MASNCGMQELLLDQITSSDAKDLYQTSEINAVTEECDRQESITCDTTQHNIACATQEQMDLVIPLIQSSEYDEQAPDLTDPDTDEESSPATVTYSVKSVDTGIKSSVLEATVASENESSNHDTSRESFKHRGSDKTADAVIHDAERDNDETNKVKQAGTNAFNAKNYSTAIVQYQLALNRLQKNSSQHSDDEKAALCYCLGLSHINTGLMKEITEGHKLFQTIIEENPTSPLKVLGFLGLAKAFVKQNRFSEALVSLDRGLDFVDLLPDTCGWPDTSVQLIIYGNSLAVARIFFKSEFEALLDSCKKPPTPVAVCRYDHCQGHGKPQIYSTDPEFKGYVQIRCAQKCLVEFHLDCWREFKLAKLDKRSDKELLNADCVTPDCQSPIVQIRAFGPDNVQLKELVADGFESFDGEVKIKKTTKGRSAGAPQVVKGAEKKKGKMHKMKENKTIAKATDEKDKTEVKSSDSVAVSADVKSADQRKVQTAGRIIKASFSLATADSEGGDNEKILTANITRNDYTALHRKDDEDMDAGQGGKGKSKKRLQREQRNRLAPTLGLFQSSLELRDENEDYDYDFAPAPPPNSSRGASIDLPPPDINAYGDKCWIIPMTSSRGFLPKPLGWSSERNGFDDSSAMSSSASWNSSSNALSSSGAMPKSSQPATAPAASWRTNNNSVSQSSNSLTKDSTLMSLRTSAGVDILSSSEEDDEDEDDDEDDDDEDEEEKDDLQGTQKSDEQVDEREIRENIFSYFESLLDRHGPLHPDDALIREELEAFPGVAQMLIIQEGGIHKFLAQSVKFSIVDGLVCLLRDVSRAQKMASARRLELLRAKKVSNAGGGVKTNVQAGAERTVTTNMSSASTIKSDVATLLSVADQHMKTSQPATKFIRPTLTNDPKNSCIGLDDIPPLIENEEQRKISEIESIKGTSNVNVDRGIEYPVSSQHIASSLISGISSSNNNAHQLKGSIAHNSAYHGFENNKEDVLKHNQQSTDLGIDDFSLEEFTSSEVHKKSEVTRYAENHSLLPNQPNSLSLPFKLPAASENPIDKIPEFEHRLLSYNQPSRDTRDLESPSFKMLSSLSTDEHKRTMPDAKDATIDRLRTELAIISKELNLEKVERAKLIQQYSSDQKLWENKYNDEVARRSSLMMEIDKLRQDLSYTRVCLDSANRMKDVTDEELALERNAHLATKAELDNLIKLRALSSRTITPPMPQQVQPLQDTRRNSGDDQDRSSLGLAGLAERVTTTNLGQAFHAPETMPALPVSSHPPKSFHVPPVQHTAREVGLLENPPRDFHANFKLSDGVTRQRSGAAGLPGNIHPIPTNVGVGMPTTMHASQITSRMSHNDTTGRVLGNDFSSRESSSFAPHFPTRNISEPLMPPVSQVQNTRPQQPSSRGPGTVSAGMHVVDNNIAATQASSVLTVKPATTRNIHTELMEMLYRTYPTVSKLDIQKYIDEVRVSRGGKLSGLSIKKISATIGLMIERDKQNRPSTNGGMPLANMPPKETLHGMMPPIGKMPIAGRMGGLDGANSNRSSPSLSQTSGGNEAHETLVDDEDDMCVICHEELTIKNTERLDCGHIYHMDCVRQWFNEQRTCPTCRKHALTPDEFPALGSSKKVGR